MNFILDIDYRESQIINLLKDTVPPINYTVSNLLIGDFLIKNNSDEIFYVIERKSIKDLCSSITDGRLREQKTRLLDTYKDPSKIIYIIEGSKKILPIGRINKNIVNSALLNLSFKHNYTTLFTENIRDTLDTLILFCEKITKGDLTCSPLTNIVNVKKSDNIDIFINQLCVIKGVSYNIAKKIKENLNCNSMNDLLTKYNNITNITDKEKLLSNININEKRKLGKVLSVNIYNALH